MQGSQVGFEASYRRHLAREQRRAVLEVFESQIGPDVTLGEVIDAAAAFGFADELGELSLADLAHVLGLRDDLAQGPASNDAPDPPRRGNGGAAHATVVPSDPDGDERMSTDRAAQVFVPVVERLGRATMQELEDETQVGRRKLRFHIGQLVKHGHLARHGMGRGTYYTVA